MWHFLRSRANLTSFRDGEETVRFYNELLGFNFTLGASFNSNQAMAATAGAPGASFRQSSATIPGTAILQLRVRDPNNLLLELVERPPQG